MSILFFLQDGQLLRIQRQRPLVSHPQISKITYLFGFKFPKRVQVKEPCERSRYFYQQVFPAYFTIEMNYGPEHRSKSKNTVLVAI